jgi:hypothetical protein
MADRYYDDDQAKLASKAKTPPIPRLTGASQCVARCNEQPCLCHVIHDVLKRELKRSVPRFPEDKGPTIILESRYGEPSELQCMATLLDALGMPLRHAVEQMYCDSQCGHIRVTICSSSIFRSEDCRRSPRSCA